MTAKKRTPRKAYRYWSPAEDAVLKERYEAGVPMNRIAEEMHRSVGAINSRLSHKQWKRPKKRTFAAADSQQMDMFDTPATRRVDTTTTQGKYDGQQVQFSRTMEYALSFVGGFAVGAAVLAIALEVGGHL